MSVLSSLFSKKKPIDFAGFTDWHCHILPGVDDGVDTIEHSLHILSEYQRIGIHKVWLTPHIMEDVPNTSDDLRARFAELKAAYCGSVELHLASEYMADAVLKERINRGDLLPIGDRRDMLLIETSYFSAPADFESILESVKCAGYHPLIAHPERYVYIGRISEYRRWSDIGARFQLNLMSLGGLYGPEAKAKARKLLEEGMYYCAGSDLHRSRHLQLLNTVSLTNNQHTYINKIFQL